MSKSSKAIMNWSGGKDSAMALYKCMCHKEYDIQCLFTSMNAQTDRISMHGVRSTLLEKQAASIGLPLQKVLIPDQASMKEYEEAISIKMNEFIAEGVNVAIFGDIFLEDLKAYREDQLRKVHFQTFFPLWKQDTTLLMDEFLRLGFKTIVTCVNEAYLDKSFAGRIIDRSFLAELPQNVDPCGENGEFHTFVFDGPIFRKPINFSIGETVYRKYTNTEDPHLQHGFWYTDLIPENE